MRGKDQRPEVLFSYVSLETRIPADHPLRPIREIVDEALRKLSPAFSRLYAREGRPSIPPERLLRALLLQAFYTIRSERQLMEQLHYNLLYRWFVGLGVDDPVWVPTVFTKKPQPAAGRRGGTQVSGRASQPQRGSCPAFGRALFRRRHADCRLGLDEELR